MEYVFFKQNSLRSRCLEVVGEKENPRARETHVSPSRAPSFLVPTTSKHLLRTLQTKAHMLLFPHPLSQNSKAPPSQIWS